MFWGLWGKTEHLDEESSSELVALDKKLMERQLVIALCKSGIMLPES